MTRVVVTGMGVVAPNGVGLEGFTAAIRNGQTGLRFFPHLKAANMGCCIGGIPDPFDDSVLRQHLNAGAFRSLRSATVKYALVAAIEAWSDAGLAFNGPFDLDTGCIMGSGACDVDHMRYAIDFFEKGEIQKLGTRHIEQLMASGPAAYIGGLFGLGNQVMANSSACSTGTEAVVLAYERIRSGQAKRMIAGSCEGPSQYIWAIFDAMRVLNRNHNDDPEAASRPMGRDSAGFVPGSGAGALVLEDLETALGRNARIYGEIRGGFVNSGGQRNGGSMTAPGGIGVRHCIEQTIARANIDASDIDLVCGHLTGTMADPLEIENWSAALQLPRDRFPAINSLKSLTGHCISATGAIECVASVLQMHHGFVQPNKNCADIHPAILDKIGENPIVRRPVEKDVRTVIKANFGFGDVNSCVVFQKLNP
jgi:3-oxoacyl-[acyl-carrier-protein] synthase I